MIYGYARVSSKDQCLDRQLEAINNYHKPDFVYTDKQSGKNFERTAYQEMKSKLLSGDEIIIEELDRLGRNKEEVKKELQWFKNNNVIVRILDVPTTLIDFQGQNWIGEMVNNILIEVLAAIAEQERLKIRKRQKEGIDAMKARGDWDRYGRPELFIDVNELKKLNKLQKEGIMTVDECCKRLNICKATWYSNLKKIVQIY